MRYLPLFHNLQGRRCLVIGGGAVALRKIRLLLDAGATVMVVAEKCCTPLQAFIDEGKVLYLGADYGGQLVSGCALVVAATSDETLNARASVEAQGWNVPINVVDNISLSTVILPSIIDRSPVQIAISTGGTSPVLARLVRARLEGLIPSFYGRLAELANKFRPAVKHRLSGDQRKLFWEGVLQGRVAELVAQNKPKEAEQLLQELLKNHADGDNASGEVYLVGAGPGDPELLTFRALRLMQQADVVLYDRLVSKEVLALVRRDADMVYVGKKAGDHPVTQENINLKLVEYARQGKRVVRLKGGDPFIFGRGGEELETLAENGIPFQVVPGITAASGCAAYAGIPLTHRDYAQSVRFVTGHLKSGNIDLRWQELVQPNQTLVFYMGLSGLETICQQLIAHGMSQTMPVALIEKGTSLRQRVFVSDLAGLPEMVRSAEAKAPTLIIVGEVVRLRDELKWFGDVGSKPG